MNAVPIASFIHEKQRIKQAALLNDLVEETFFHKPLVINRFGQVMNDLAAQK